MRLALYPLGVLLVLPLLLRATPASNSRNMQSRPLSFIENNGQVTGPDKKPRTDIDVKLKAPGVTIYIGDGQIHYMWRKKIPNSKSPGTDRKFQLETYRMDVELVGANTNAEIIKEEQQEYYENYFLPQCPGGITAHTYSKITYRNIYPNIDWVLYASGNELKYDFVVRPGGKASDIRLRYKGATSLRMKDGALTARTPMGSITEQKPYSYDAVTKREIPSSFVLKNGELRFNVGASENTIVIDPVLAWGSYLGESGQSEYPQAVATDSLGNLFICGYADADDEITYPGLAISYQPNLNGSCDAFLAKFNRDGKWIWATYYGGSGEDYSSDITVHSNGNIYFTGTTNSPVGLSFSPNVHQTNNNGGNDAYVAVFDPAGWPVWGSYFGGPDDDDAARLAVDRFGDVYITGKTRSDTLIATPTAFQDTTSGGYSDAYLAKFGSSGNTVLWSTFLGAGLDDAGTAVAVDAEDNVFLTGVTWVGFAFTGRIYLTPDAELVVPYITFGPANIVGFLAKFSAPGNLLYCSHLAMIAKDMCTDTAGNVYMAAGSVAKLNNAGKTQWKKGRADERIRLDNEGNIYTAGSAYEDLTIATAGAQQTDTGGGFDGYIIKYDTAGNKTWASLYGGLYNDRIMGLALDRRNKLYVCGNTSSPNNIATPDGHKPAWTGNFLTVDGFFAKWHDTIGSVFPVTDTVICPPDTIDVSYMVEVVFRNGNVFTAQLSDASGSFANPTTIGSIASDTNETIQCVIPANTPPGTGYRIRVVASTPAFIMADIGQTIQILEHPVPTITGITEACTSDSLGITATSTVPGVSFLWSLPAGNTQSGASVLIPQAASQHTGSYIVTVSNQGCTSTDSIRLTVHPRPYVVKMSTTAPVCAGNSFNIDVEGSMPNVHYSWAGPAGFTSAEKTPVISAAEPKHAGYYFVFMTSDKGCVSDSNGVFADIVRLEASIKSIPVRTPGDTINLEGSSNTDSVTWSWEGPGGFTSNMQNPILEDIGIDRRGDYFLTISKYGCTARASTNVIVSELIRFNLYPNPNNGRFTIMGNTLKDQLVQMEIVDVAGRAIYRDEVQTFRRHFKKEVNTQGRLSAGSYILRLDVEGKEQDLHFAVGE